MVPDEIGYDLHDRATRGQSLTADERVQLEEWYARKDAEEAAAYSINDDDIPDLDALQAEIDATKARIRATEQKIRDQEEANQRLRTEIETLRAELERRRRAKTTPTHVPNPS